jgi:hypothetical protein
MIARLASNQSPRSKTNLRWRTCYWLGLILVFVWAVWQRWWLPLDPLADPDTWGYLSPALRKLTGAEFGHTNGRNFVYPAFLFLLLRLFGNFRAITITQHFLGLLAGVIFLLTWKRTRIFVPNPRVGTAAYDFLGLCGAGIFLLQWQTIVVEKQIRPEGICAVVLSLTLYFLIQFLAFFFLEHRPAASARSAIGLAFSAILLASLKPSFVFASVFILSPVIALFWRRGWRWQKVGFCLGCAVSAAVFLLPEHFLSRTDEMSRTFLPTTLFVIHADMIRDQLADDLEKNVSLPYSRDRLERIYLALNSEIPKSHAVHPLAYRSLGFDPDILMHDPTSIATQTSREFEDDVAVACAFYRFYYWRIWQKQPRRMLEKIGRQMLIFYLPYCRAYDARIVQKLDAEYQLSLASLSDSRCRQVWIYPPAIDFMARTQEVVQRNLRFPQLLLLVPLGVFLVSISYATWLIAALVLALIVALNSGRWGRLRFIAAVVMFLFSFNAACCLEVAIISSLDLSRYVTVQMYSTLFAQLLGLWFILEFIVEMWQRRKAQNGPEPPGTGVR